MNMDKDMEEPVHEVSISSMYVFIYQFIRLVPVDDLDKCFCMESALHVGEF